MRLFDIGQGGTRTLCETLEWCESRKSLGIADKASMKCVTLREIFELNLKQFMKLPTQIKKK